MDNPFAVFVLVAVPGGFAGTTRAADRGESGKVGLPGGKVDPGESPVDAAIRESAEEGWEIAEVSPEPVHAQLVDGKPVVWFLGHGARKLESFKEQGRISPVVLSREQVLGSGFGNENLPL